MKITITKDHFDRAVKQDWSTRTCILAQVYSDNCEEKYKIQPELGVFDYDSSRKCVEIREIFDKEFKIPGDAQKPRLQELRNSLPITVEI